MKSFIYLYATLFLFLLFSACANEGGIYEGEVQKINVGPGFTNDKSANLSDYAEQLINVPLETKPECVIGKIAKIAYIDNKLYIQDEQTQKLFIFDDQGKYLSRIDQIGRGPSEYIEITDFTASLKENNIVIYDDKQQKVLKYDLDGNFIDATRINYWPLGISFTPNQKELALVSPRPMEVYSNNHSIMVMDKSWKPKAQLIKHDIEDTEDYLKKSICFYTFFEYEDSLTLWESYCDTIFRITDDRKVIPRYHLDLGKDNMPHELAAYDEKFNHHITEYSIIDKVLESKHYLFISGIYKGYLKEIFCDKRSNECHNLVFNLSIKDHGFHNDIDGGAPFWPYGVVGNGWVFGSFQATDLQTYWTFDDYFDNMEVKYPERQKTLEAIVENSTIDSNPIIQLVKLK